MHQSGSYNVTISDAAEMLELETASLDVSIMGDKRIDLVCTTDRVPAATRVVVIHRDQVDTQSIGGAYESMRAGNLRAS